MITGHRRIDRRGWSAHGPGGRSLSDRAVRLHRCAEYRRLRRRRPPVPHRATHRRSAVVLTHRTTAVIGVGRDRIPTSTVLAQPADSIRGGAPYAKRRAHAPSGTVLDAHARAVVDPVAQPTRGRRGARTDIRLDASNRRTGVRLRIGL